MKAIRGFTLAATVGTLFAAIMGSYVRGKGAGLACPDWPLCHGRLIPPLEGLILLEWFHRLIVLGVTFLVVASVFLLWRQRLPERSLGLVVVGMLLTQAVLGGITVLIRLDPLVVALHQGLALVFFATLVVLTVLAFGHRETAAQGA